MNRAPPHPAPPLGPGALIGALLLLLTGCATPPHEPLPDSREAAWEAHWERVLAVTDWELQGRVAVRTEHDGGRVGMNWTQQGESYELVLNGPFGSGEVTLTGDGGGAVLVGPGDEQGYYHPDAAVLLEAYTGYALPVKALAYWVRGIPAPGRGREWALNDHGRLEQLRQGPWTVTYEQYREVDGAHLPVRLSAEGPGMRLRLAIHGWQRLETDS